MKNIKVIIGIILGIIIVSSISVYATATYLYNATDVGYNNTSVAGALDDLYDIANNYKYTEQEYQTALTTAKGCVVKTGTMPSNRKL